jgi:hypothetical protein
VRVPISEILARGDDRVFIPELGLRVQARGDLAAFWAGHRAGRAGEPLPKNIEYDDPAIYRRAHKAGVSSRKELT